MRKIKTPQSQGRDYEKMLKDYFGKFLYGLEVIDTGLHVSVQVAYWDFKHIETVRRELAQMMPEVEFVKVRRCFTSSALEWAIVRMLHEHDGFEIPDLFIQKDNDTLVRTCLTQLAVTELNQMELDEDDGDLPF